MSLEVAGVRLVEDHLHLLLRGLGGISTLNIISLDNHETLELIIDVIRYSGGVAQHTMWHVQLVALDTGESS